MSGGVSGAGLFQEHVFGPVHWSWFSKCWYHLVDLWCHFGAHWILKGVPQSTILEKHLKQSSLFSSMFFVSIFNLFSDGFWSHFWCFFDTFTVRTCNLLNHQKHLFFQWITMILLFKETWFLMILLIFSVTSFGIYFWWVLASILVPKWSNIGPTIKKN